MATRRIGLECCACGLIFSGEGAFKKHRTGSYGLGVTASNGVTKYAKHERRCLTEEGMRAKGLSPNEKGLWTTNISDAEEMAEEVQGSEEVEA